MSGPRFAMVPESVLCDRRIGPAGVRVFGLLALHRNRTTGECRPWASTLGASVGLGRTAVSNQIGMLERLGYVRVDRAEGKPNRYFVMLADRAGEIENQDANAPRLMAGKTPNPPREMAGGATLDGGYPPRDVAHKNRGIEQSKDRASGQEPKRAEILQQLTAACTWHPETNPKLVGIEYNKALKRGTDPATILAGAQAYGATVRRDGRPRDRVQSLHKWLAVDGWVVALANAPAALDRPATPEARAAAIRRAEEAAASAGALVRATG